MPVSKSASPWIRIMALGGLLVALLAILVSLQESVQSMAISSSSLAVRATLEEGWMHTLGTVGDFSLAKEQSFGFFDDITDTHWRAAQEIHARRFPNHYTDLTRNSGDSKRSNWWNAQNFQEEFHCPHAERIPSSCADADGQKWVCDPSRIAKQTSCLVYSVGSAGNTLFERGVKEEIGPHCEIHTFDPVTYNRRNGKFSKALEPYSTFHPWGISTAEEADKSRKRGGNMKTLEDTIRELGHENRTIDIFKIDCEGCEWSTYSSWLAINNDIRQILVETHDAPMPQAAHFFHDLHDAGYVITSKEANYIVGGRNVEFAFLKLRTDFFIHDSMYNKEPGSSQ